MRGGGGRGSLQEAKSQANLQQIFGEILSERGEDEKTRPA